MDHKFTELIKQWLETPSDQRDYSVGALYLLKLSGNQIMYRNIVVFDDFVTTGQTLVSMQNLLVSLGKNCTFFAGINNKL